MEQVNSAYCSPEFPLTASVSFFPVCDKTTLYLHLCLYLYFSIIVIGCPGCFLNKWSIVHIVVLLVAHHYPLQFPWISIGNKSNMWSRHITIQILSRIALEHTISNTNNIRVFFLATKCLRKGFIVSDWRSPKSLSQTHYAIFYQCHCQFVNFIVCLFVRSAKNTSATFSISLEDIYVVEQASDKT